MQIVLLHCYYSSYRHVAANETEMVMKEKLDGEQSLFKLNVPLQFNSNDFMNFFTDKIDRIRNTITNIGSSKSCNTVSFIAVKKIPYAPLVLTSLLSRYNPSHSIRS